ncbi:MAG: transposase family protein [Caldilineaceae bacterium]
MILFVGRTFSGHHHDDTMLKTEFPPDYDWFAALTVLVDLGYLGIRTDYTGADILLPHKKPRQSQRNPQPILTPAQKADNRAISQVRVAIEQALAGLKRYNILIHRFRNRRANFHDEVIALCAGLWNFALIY